MAQSSHCRPAPSLARWPTALTVGLTLVRQADTPRVPQANAGYVSERLSSHQTANQSNKETGGLSGPLGARGPV